MTKFILVTIMVVLVSCGEKVTTQPKTPTVEKSFFERYHNDLSINVISLNESKFKVVMDMPSFSEKVRYQDGFIIVREDGLFSEA